MPTKILTTAAVALAALLLSSPGAGPAQALSFGPVVAPAEIQASSSIELAAMRGSGHRVWTLNRGGFGGSRFAYRGGNYGRSYGRSYGARRYGHAYPWRHRYVNGRYYRHGYRRGIPGGAMGRSGSASVVTTAAITALTDMAITVTMAGMMLTPEMPITVMAAVMLPVGAMNMSAGA